MIWSRKRNNIFHVWSFNNGLESQDESGETCDIIRDGSIQANDAFIAPDMSVNAVGDDPL